MPLVVKTANTDRPLYSFCIVFLLGSKYAGLALAALQRLYRLGIKDQGWGNAASLFLEVKFVFRRGGVRVLKKCEIVYKKVLKNKLIRHLSMIINKDV